MNVRTALAISVGAVIGAALRWATTLWSGPGGVDLALLVVNVAGASLLGFLSQLRRAPFAPGSVRVLGEDLVSLLGAGLCGALTTWSTLALRTASELREGSVPDAVLWLVCNLVLGIGAAAFTRSASRRRSGLTIPVEQPGPRS